MVNVLPITERKNIYNDYRRRIVVVSLTMLSVLILAAIVMLVPSLAIFSVKKEAVTKQLQSLKDNKQVQVTGNALNEIKKAREYMEIISPDNSILMSSRIKDIVLREHPGVYIKSFIASNTNTIEIRGEASSRESIPAYVAELEKSQNIEKVDSPISNIISGQNSQFVIRITMKSN